MPTPRIDHLTQCPPMQKELEDAIEAVASQLAEFETLLEQDPENEAIIQVLPMPGLLITERVERYHTAIRRSHISYFHAYSSSKNCLPL